MAKGVGLYGFRKNGADKVTKANLSKKAILQYCQRNFAMDLIFDRIELTADECGGLPLGKLESAALMRGKAYAQDAQAMLLNGLYDYAYILNLDTQSLEFWITRLDYPPQENRYTLREDYSGFFGWHPYLATEFLIKDIVAGGPLGIDGFIRQMQAAEKEKKVNAAS